MTSSLLGRMIVAQGLSMLIAWSLLLGIILGQLTWSRTNIWDEDLELMASSLALLLQDEREPARMVVQARKLQRIDEDTTGATGLVRPHEYRSIHQVFDREGRLLVRSEIAPVVPMSRSGPGFHDEIVEGQPWRVFVKVDTGSGLKVLTGQRKSLGHLVIWRSLRKVLPLQVLIGLVIVSLFTWLVVRRALKPMLVLAQAVEARDPSDLRPLEGFRELAETRPLIDGLNRLFRRVEELLGHQRRFVADAAHELRTPLAVIGAQAHVLRRAKNEAQLESARKDLQLGVQRTEQLVGQLLSVARLDDPAETVARNALDLASLARERVELLASQAGNRRQKLSFEGPEHLSWRGDAAILVSALDNLLVNAICYTQEGGRIILRMMDTGKGLCIEVEDDGPGIPPEAREAIFERFHRLPGSPGTGSGLGLAIVRQAVERHGGHVTLQEGNQGRGLRVVIELPQVA